MLNCDWCGEHITSGLFATLKPGGCYADGAPIRLAPRTYHTSYKGFDGDGMPYESCCFSQALKLLDGRELKSPDAGMRWVLAPASEVQNTVYNDTYTDPALGTTPLAELGLTPAIYKKLTRAGYFTVEHLADARLRGVEVISGKALAKVDAALLERGALSAEAVEAGS
jgi:hypothetical protein